MHNFLCRNMSAQIMYRTSQNGPDGFLNVDVALGHDEPGQTRTWRQQEKDKWRCSFIQELEPVD